MDEIPNRADADYKDAHESFHANIRFLSIFNGGGAIALLGLLGRMITKEQSLFYSDPRFIMNALVISIAIFCLGLLTSGAANTFGIKSKRRWAKWHTKNHKLIFRLEKGNISSEKREAKENELDEIEKDAKAYTTTANRLSVGGYGLFTLGIGVTIFAFLLVT